MKTIKHTREYQLIIWNYSTSTFEWNDPWLLTVILHWCGPEGLWYPKHLIRWVKSDILPPMYKIIKIYVHITVLIYTAACWYAKLLPLIMYCVGFKILQAEVRNGKKNHAQTLFVGCRFPRVQRRLVFYTEWLYHYNSHLIAYVVSV